MKNAAIYIEDLTLAYREDPVIWDVDLVIPDNVRCAIVGPNGAGKSSLIKGALGLIKPIAGFSKFWGQDLDQVKKRISYVPQKGKVNWDFPTNVLDVVVMGRYPHLGLARRPKKRDRDLAMEALKEMKMEDFADRQISQLSGGQKQRVFLARSICQDADLYIMDEPLAGVDENTEKIIMEKFVDLQNKGKTIVAVHHDLNSLSDYFDYLVILNKTVKKAGPIDEILTRENLDLAYSGGDLLDKFI